MIVPLSNYQKFVSKFRINLWGSKFLVSMARIIGATEKTAWKYCKFCAVYTRTAFTYKLKCQPATLPPSLMFLADLVTLLARPFQKVLNYLNDLNNIENHFIFRQFSKITIFS